MIEVEFIKNKYLVSENGRFLGLFRYIRDLREFMRQFHYRRLIKRELSLVKNIR